jgi:hypothetical protein
MIRAFLIAAWCFVPAALAFHGTNWIEVSGGSWKPDASVLSAAEIQLKVQLTEDLRKPITPSVWGSYTFQYQGISNADGHKLVHVNAVRSKLISLTEKESHVNYNLAKDWFYSYGGGSCCFQGDFDPVENSVSKFRVNAAK